MRAAVLAVGSELLGSERLDTNSLRLATVFERWGVELVAKSVIGDDEAAIAGELARRCEHVDVVVISGGLGPTADDVTRAAVARAAGVDLAIDEALVDWLLDRYARLGRKMPEVNRRQAEVLAGAEVLPNDLGTAPGQRLRVGECEVFMFPGVPVELDAMVERDLEPWLRAEAERRGLTGGIERRLLKVACLAESVVEERIAPAYERFGREAITVLSSPGEVKIFFAARGAADERRRRLAEMDEELRALAGEAVYTDRAEASLESVVGELLAAAGRTVATAESCTGGLIAELLTRVAGSSEYFLGGVVTYSNELKIQLLGVSKGLLTQHGAVSEPVARAMAEGARRRLESDYAVAVTGVAGPGGGSDEKPVGTVHLALAGPGETLEHRRVRFPGDRRIIRRLTAFLALEMLRRTLLAAAR